METPIVDFVHRYAESRSMRLHMPGHKGAPLLGMEALDITEIEGADSLYEASGIIQESESNASALFGCDTLYSTEGSSLCIRAMLHLVLLHAKQSGKKPLIAAGRNAHKTFLSAAALLDFDIAWLYPQGGASYLSCDIDLSALEHLLEAKQPAAVYITSPDYLGNVADVRAIAELCHRYGTLLAVDNAHGAYLRFLPASQHPIDLGADICCDSAHKTLPVLTGGAYLHIAKHAPEVFAAQAKTALALFGSTSPSYLILQSLDYANQYLADGYREKLSTFASRVQSLKDALTAHGYELNGNEPLKITIGTKPYGYSGKEFAAMLAKENIICEFADRDFTVMMLTPEIDDGLDRLASVLCSIEQKDAVDEQPPVCKPQQRILSVRQAAFSACEIVPAAKSYGRVLAAATVGCPPAVPIVICGERIDEHAVKCFEYYDIETCTVVQ